MGLRAVTVVPLLLWGEQMSDPLPKSFMFEMPDESMSPRIKAGKLIIFSTAEAAKPGDAVLVADREGVQYVRKYLQSKPGAWQAAAINEAYQPLDSERDGLHVLAVLIGEEGRWT